jgi:hypothetical protein
MRLCISDLQGNPTGAVIRAFYVLVFLSFTAGDISAQISNLPPETTALPADRIYVNGITASIPGYNRMTDIDKVRALRLYVYQHTPVGDPLIHDFVVNLPLTDAYAILERAGGVYCGGAAIFLSRVYKAAGFNSWIYNFGDSEGSGASHATTLVEVDGELILQDAYLNYEYVDAQGKPIQFLDLISRIVDGAPPTAKAGVANRPWMFDALAAAEKSAARKDAMNCKTVATGLRCNAIITLSGFLENNPAFSEFLEFRGWPRQFEYLMLYPMSVDSLYPDGDAGAQTLLENVQGKVSDALKTHSPKTP